MIPNVSQPSLYPSLAAMRASINTAISTPITLSRRVINDIEEHERRVLNSYAEGMNRRTNTSPIQSLDKQHEEITSTTKGQKAAITQVETQEETLQPESLGKEDTSMNQADATQGQDPMSVQAQEVEENEVPVAKDTSNMQVPVGNEISQAKDKKQDPEIPEDQISRT